MKMLAGVNHKLLYLIRFILDFYISFDPIRIHITKLYVVRHTQSYHVVLDIDLIILYCPRHILLIACVAL